MTFLSRLLLATTLLALSAPPEAFAADEPAKAQKSKSKKKKKGAEPSRPNGGRPIKTDEERKADDAKKNEGAKQPTDGQKPQAPSTETQRTDSTGSNPTRTETKGNAANTPGSQRPTPPGAAKAATAAKMSAPERIEASRAVVDASQRKPAVDRPKAEEGRVSSHASDERRPYHSRDHRYARPHHHHVRAHPHAHHPPPAHHWYRGWYSHWWVHPYYRWQHAVWVVHFGWAVAPWEIGWAPPARAGWAWVPGHWQGPVWVPGHWTPVAAARAWYGVQWAFVPGFWVGDAYVEGYWRRDSRTDGDWVWVEGHYLEDGSFVPGYWAPNREPPKGYAWEPGFWDGETWVEGFWRPTTRNGYVWVSSRYDKNGTFQAGYWEPTAGREGHVWVPGWFDGNQWHSGEWVPQAEYDQADPQSWEPEAGVDDGWDSPLPKATEAAPAEGEEVPLAIPVDAVDAM